MSERSAFQLFFAANYEALKQDNPADSLRKLKLRAAQKFWELTPETRQAANWPSAPIPNASTEDDGAMGIIVRTNYENEDAWKAWCAKLKDAEKELMAPDDAEMADVNEASGSSNGGGSAQAGSSSTAPQDSAEGDEMEEDGEDDDDEEEGEGEGDEADGESSMFSIFSPPPSDPQALHNASNILALRTFNDIDIVSSLIPPQGTKRIKPPNRLIDQDGLQEVYVGKTVWVYDKRSNDDGSVRMINSRSDVYGTATADSWRARVSFLPELQLNLFTGAMKIDFGGQDRWDYNERIRNLAEATSYPV